MVLDFSVTAYEMLFLYGPMSSPVMSEEIATLLFPLAFKLDVKSLIKPCTDKLTISFDSIKLLAGYDLKGSLKRNGCSITILPARFCIQLILFCSRRTILQNVGFICENIPRNESLVHLYEGINCAWSQRISC